MACNSKTTTVGRVKLIEICNLGVLTEHVLGRFVLEFSVADIFHPVAYNVILETFDGICGHSVHWT